MNIVNRFFKPDQSLIDYLTRITVTDWTPQFCVYHNTGSPDLMQRPDGFTSQHMENLASYYESLSWHAGPHFFVDQNGVWAFSPITQPGVHSPSWNKVSLGIEHLGDYDTDDPTSGDGAKVIHNGIVLLAALHVKFGLDSDTLKPHYADPLTLHKDCPGHKIDFDSIIDRVHNEIVLQRP